MPLYAEPGTEFHYGESMGVLGRLIEVVSGMTFRDYIRTKILQPAGMVDTDFFVPGNKEDRLTTLYFLNEDRELVDSEDAQLYGGSYLQPPVLEYGGAGLVGTPRDYLRFATMLINKGTIDGVRVLSPESVATLTTNHLPEIFGNVNQADSEFGFGYCGQVNTISTETTNAGEYGWGGWASTDFWMDPERRTTGLVFTQVIPDVLGTFLLAEDIRKQYSK
jgi:CubicO group peptidase (beta-lactamase class C family)